MFDLATILTGKEHNIIMQAMIESFSNNLGIEKSELESIIEKTNTSLINKNNEDKQNELIIKEGDKVIKG
jgi:hypothetical protein